MILNPKTIGSMYWSLGKMKLKTTDQVFKDLEKIIFEFFEEFDIQTINMIFGTKFYTLNRTHDLIPLLEKFIANYDYREFKVEDLPHITSLIQLGAIRTNRRSLYYEQQKQLILKMTDTFFDLRAQVGSHKYMNGSAIAYVIYAHSKLSLFNDLGKLSGLFENFLMHAAKTPSKQISWVLYAATKLERENPFQAEINTRNLAKKLIIPLRRKVKTMHPQTADLVQNCLKEMDMHDTDLHEKFEKYKKLPKHDPRIGSRRWG